MWPLVTPSRKRIEARHTSARRSRLSSPQCTPLEDRCLLSVSFSAATGETSTAFHTAVSRVVEPRAVISPTSNPLVALYSASPFLRRFDVCSVQTAGL